MAARSAQKRRTQKRKQRQAKAWALYKAANARRGSLAMNLDGVGYGQLLQRTKHAVAALLAAVEKP